MSIQGLIIAAGESRRMDQWKLALPLGNKTIIQHTIENMYDYCETIILVGGHRLDQLKKLVAEYGKIKIVENKQYQDGHHSSIKEGIRWIEGDTILYTPGDYPLIQHETYKALVFHYSLNNYPMMAEYNRIPGPPLIIPKKKGLEFVSNKENISLRDFLNKNSIQYIPVKDPGILKDIDTPVDYKNAQAYYHLHIGLYRNSVNS